MLHITKGSGKMDGVFSINTPTTTNLFCQRMSQTNTICKSCYASRYERMRPNIVKAFEKNVSILLDNYYKPERVNHTFMRLHSYGELRNYTHLINFIKLALVNPQTSFTLWTKRKTMVKDYLKSGGIKPSNMILIYSNPLIDEPLNIIPFGFDKVFNVYTKPFIKENDVTINCGGNSCKDCMLCYSKNNVSIINEIKK